MKTFISVCILLSIVFSSCKHVGKINSIPFYSKSKNHVGDSIFIDGQLQKIIFVDTFYVVDSIVYDWYTETGKLKSILTYYDGKPAFENLYFHKNGKLGTYLFQSDNCKDCFYKRTYDVNGKLTGKQGDIFFLGFVTSVDTKTLEVKKGDSIQYRIFYPNPPDCLVKVYMKESPDRTYDVFTKSRFIPFLCYTTYNTAHDEISKVRIWTQMDIGLELIDSVNDSISYYDKSLFYKLIE